MKYKILATVITIAALWAYAPAHFWPLLEFYAAAECLLLIVSLFTK